MAAISTNVTNLLSPINYAFKLTRTPNVNYAVQQVSIPGLNLGSIDIPTPHVRLPFQGNINYDELRITFKVGEDLANYLEIFNWMNALGHPDGYSQYEDQKSDASVIILASSKRPSISVDFTDCYPTSLSTLDFDSTITDIQYVTVDATFKFTRFYYNVID